MSIDCERCRLRGYACLFLACKGYQRDVPASLHGDGYLSLVPCAVARYPAWKYLAAFCDEEPERLYVFVIDKGGFVHAEPANFFSNLEASSFVASSPPRIPAVSSVFASIIGTSI
jgi:hypothetical protein